MKDPATAFQRALTFGQTAFAAEVLLCAHRCSSCGWSRQVGYDLGKKWTLLLPEAHPLRQDLTETFGYQPPFFEPRGVLWLAAYEGGDGNLPNPFGCVGRLEYGTRALSTFGADQFALHEGLNAALTWLQRTHGPVNLDGPQTFALQTLTGQPFGKHLAVVESRGASLALAATLAVAWQYLGRLLPFTTTLAATGCVDGHGNILRVKHLATKLEALARELPSTGKVFIPKGNETDVPTVLQNKLQLVPVSTVDEMLERVFKDLTPEVCLPTLDPLQAAHNAVLYEIEGLHGPACQLARKAKENIESAQLSPQQVEKVLCRATMVLAIDQVHHGQPQDAEHQFRELEARLNTFDPALRREVKTLDWWLCWRAKRVSALIDCLEPERTLALCEEDASSAEAWASDRTCIEFFGSWARALCAAGRAGEALEKVQRQLEGVHEGNAFERPRILCNEIEARLCLAREGRTAGDDHVLERTLDQAKRANADLPVTSNSERNRYFLLLHRLRFLALRGQGREALACFASAFSAPEHPQEVDRPVELVEGLKTNWCMKWPQHHYLRFVAEALWREGCRDAALHLLRIAADSIALKTSPFFDLVLRTASALEALLRIEAGLDGWQKPGQEFLKALTAYKPGLVELPADDAPAALWCNQLERGLAIIPY